MKNNKFINNNISAATHNLLYLAESLSANMLYLL